ncbi:MAG TPA: NAD(P)H-hydrate dehydratase [Candidatus Dormibacteraeota bacterium]|nr:NAD(P)H-hydrate dehydratase [Candidatus Dormibacteraeota bacterium]
MTSSDEVRAWLPRPRPGEDKDARGRVLVVGGSLRYSGAPLLVATGALKTGAGIVTLAVARSLAMALAGRVPELTFLPLDEASPGVIDSSAARQIASGLGEGRYRAMVVGPGLGHDPTTDALVLGTLARATVPVVIDADGLNALARTSDWPKRLPPDAVLTPHAREAARLAGGDVGEPRVEWASDRARAWGAVLVLKGACTVVASAGGDVFAHDRPNPALATAGSGDVLSGCIAALAAGGLVPYRAACAAVVLQGEAGDLVAREVGVRGATAGDLAARLPRALESLSA